MTIIERLTHEAVQLDPTDPRRIVMRDAIQRVHQQQAEIERLTAERNEAREEVARYAVIHALSETRTVEHFLALDDPHKRVWFAAAIDESERRKQAEAENARLRAALGQVRRCHGRCDYCGPDAERALTGGA